MNTQGQEGHYLVLQSEADLHSFRVVAQSMEMEQDEVEDHRGTNGEYLEVWSSPDGSRKLSWIESPRVFGRFMWYIGPDADNTVTVLTHALPCETAEQVRLRLSQPEIGHDDLVCLLHLVAYVTPRATTDVLTAFREALKDSRRGIRLSAVRAYAIRRWPELLTEIERLVEQDPEPDVKAFADKVVKLTRSELDNQ